MATARKSKTFLSHYQALIRSFRKHLPGAQRLGEEAIHDLRVDVKNLRALLALIEKASGKKFKKDDLFQLIEPVFDSAGKVRAAQIHLGLLRKLGNTATERYKRFLLREKKKQGVILHEILKNFDHTAFETRGEDAVKAVQKLRDKKILSRAEKEIEKTYEAIARLAKNKKAKHLHEIRKSLKIVKAYTKLLETLDGDKKWTRRLKRIKRTETLIGEWHDRDVLLDEMKTFAKAHRALPGVLKMKPLIERLGRRNGKAVKPIFKALKKTLPG